MKLTPAQKEAVINKLLSTSEGKMKLAASMQNPLRERLDYEGVFRRAVVVDPLPQGALPYYDKDINVPAIVISEEGQTPETIIKGKRILIPLFELGSNPKIPFTQVKERRYNLIDRAQDKAKQEIQAAEDELGFSALDVALAQVDPDPWRDGDGFSKADAHDALLILLPLRGRCSRLSAESSKVRFLCRIRPPKHGNEVYASSSSGSKSR